jgi:hypothetical protein
MDNNVVPADQFYNASIDDNTIQNFNSFHCYDAYNNYTFSVTRKKGTTFINPSFKDDSLIELKVGVLLPFHQNNNNRTRIMTMRYNIQNKEYCKYLLCF